MKSTRPGTSSKLSPRSSPNSSSKLDYMDNIIKLGSMDKLDKAKAKAKAKTLRLTLTLTR